MFAIPLRRLRQHGFSLMEITIGLVLLGVLGVAGSNMIAGSFYTTQVISNGHLGNANARYAMDRMVRDIREISYDSVNDVLGISAMSPNQLSFTKSGLAGATTTVIFNFAKPTLTMTVAGTQATLASDVSSLTFTYLDTNLAVTAVAKDVRFVRIALTLAPAQAQSIDLLTQVRLRNI